jgi:hypothetical protein
LSDSENERKRELECLRLASDLRQLGRDAQNPELSASSRHECLDRKRSPRNRPADRASLFRRGLSVLDASIGVICYATLPGQLGIIRRVPGRRHAARLPSP